jgi:hypothetical protein
LPQGAVCREAQMSASNSRGREPKYDRAFLLSSGKRNQVMELWEVQKYGADSFSDPDYVCIYGMKPAEWYGRGVRLLARTTVEATRDKLGAMIGADVRSIIESAALPAKFGVVDPFAGSCNSLYWILRQVSGAKGLGFEVENTIFDMTRRNIASLETRIELINGDYRSLLGTHRFPADHFVVAFLAPPWGDALSPATGLDLRRTKPPVCDIVDDFERVYRDTPILCVTQVHQIIEPDSLSDLKKKFDWSDLRIYDIDVEGMKHGVLLGANRWTPRSE